jgi:hypothetical protein
MLTPSQVQAVCIGCSLCDNVATPLCLTALNTCERGFTVAVFGYVEEHECLGCRGRSGGNYVGLLSQSGVDYITTCTC